MTDVEKLLALEEIKQLKARYFRCMDKKDWKGYLAVFTPDATLDSSESSSPTDYRGEPLRKLYAPHVYEQARPHLMQVISEPACVLYRVGVVIGVHADAHAYVGFHFLVA